MNRKALIEKLSRDWTEVLLCSHRADEAAGRGDHRMAEVYSLQGEEIAHDVRTALEENGLTESDLVD